MFRGNFVQLASSTFHYENQFLTTLLRGVEERNVARNFSNLRTVGEDSRVTWQFRSERINFCGTKLHRL